MVQFFGVVLVVPHGVAIDAVPTCTSIFNLRRKFILHCLPVLDQDLKPYGWNTSGANRLVIFNIYCVRCYSELHIVYGIWDHFSTLLERKSSILDLSIQYVFKDSLTC